MMHKLRDGVLKTVEKDSSRNALCISPHTNHDKPPLLLLHMLLLLLSRAGPGSNFDGQAKPGREISAREEL